jgi:alkaline phosphatase
LILFLPACSGGIDSKSSSGKAEKPEVKNIILMIGDGMGVAQVYAAITKSTDTLNLEKFPVIGFHKSYSADNYITDSGAGGTALATGHKTFNGAIAVDTNKEVLTTILEIAEANGLATGLVATSSITHATPASFVAHQASRNNYEAIAEDILKSGVDVFIGGGRKYFTKRDDGKDFTIALREKGYQVVYDLDEITKTNSGKLAGLTAEEHNPSVLDGRDDLLPLATSTALRLLSHNQRGFFLMVEGSQIDWGGHANDLDYVIAEVLDFDKAIGKAMEFAKKDGHTLVIVTADHETGGLTLDNGNIRNRHVEGKFSTDGHTAVMVPVFAYGPGAETFSGIYENTAIFEKLMNAYHFEED